MMVQRIRFTAEVQKCIRENRQLSLVQNRNAAIKTKLGERLLNKETPEGDRSTMMALQLVIHEQSCVLQQLMQTKSPEELWASWQEQMRFYYDDKEGTIE